MTDSTQAVVNRYSYDSFGNVQRAETVWNDFTFTGREYDSETGLLFLRARYYDPEVGRFVSKDPIGFAGGINHYNYLDGNPINFVDPLGLFNPTKGFTSILNAANAGRLYATGFLKLAVAAGLDMTVVGAPVGTSVALIGVVNIYSAATAKRRALQLWEEALQENWSDATRKNFLGVLPYGEMFDDPCEPAPGDIYKKKLENVTESPSRLWEFIKEFGTAGL